MSQLNKMEQKIVSKLPKASQAEATATLLAAKAETEAWVKRNRSEFSVKVNDKGNIVIYGLGNRFPVTFRPEQLSLFLSRVGDITPYIAQAEAVRAGLSKNDK